MVDLPKQKEKSMGLDEDLRGLIASIGIKKGKEFAPDERMKKILTDAAKIGSVTARALTARPKDERFYIYPGKRVWTNPFTHPTDYAEVKDGNIIFGNVPTAYSPYDLNAILAAYTAR